MIVPGEVWKKMNQSDRDTVIVLGGISALCAITAIISFQSSIKDYSQFYFKLGDESYQAVQGALVFVAMMTLFVLKIFAAASADKKPEASPHSVPASNKVTFSKQPSKKVPPTVANTPSSSSSTSVIVPATNASDSHQPVSKSDIQPASAEASYMASNSSKQYSLHSIRVGLIAGKK